MPLFFGLLLMCALSVFSDLLTASLNIPIPAAIVGLLTLTGIFLIAGKTHPALDRTSQTLTLILPLLIMPSCIGIMDHWQLFKEEWLAITLAISCSAVLTLITTPWIMSKMHLTNEPESQ